MAAIPFQIEVVEPGLGLVIARQLQPQKFKVVPGQTTLGGCPVMASAHPPATDPDTAMRDDLLVFPLRRREDAGQFKAGQFVDLAGYSA